MVDVVCCSDYFHIITLQQSVAVNKSAAASMPVAGIGEVDRAQIAQQMAAALIAQGKTDVSSEELAQLVDAVVRCISTALCGAFIPGPRKIGIEALSMRR